jgi:hypothetical protein
LKEQPGKDTDVGGAILADAHSGLVDEYRIYPANHIRLVHPCSSLVRGDQVAPC